MITMEQFVEALDVQWEIAVALADCDGIKEMAKKSRAIRYRYRKRAEIAIQTWQKSLKTGGKA